MDLAKLIAQLIAEYRQRAASRPTMFQPTPYGQALRGLLQRGTPGDPGRTPSRDAQAQTLGTPTLQAGMAHGMIAGPAGAIAQGVG